ncbi:hypothetical protein SEA_CAMERICO_35 [Gordonia phage Camerico]|nr:hypothetical protein SEA_CAMERICO_35 [Gordonia phage Camerico]
MGIDQPSNDGNEVEDMGTAENVQGQFLGEGPGGPSKSLGWLGLAPQPDNSGKRISQFRVIHRSKGGAEVDRQTLVEALGTLVFEATFRIKGVTEAEKAKAMIVDAERGETVLGHAAVASGLALTNNDLLVQILQELKKVK